MIPPRRLDNGKLRVPRRCEGPEGFVGDGIVDIGPDDPEYAAWEAELNRLEHPSPDVATLAAVNALTHGDAEAADEILGRVQGAR